MWYAIEPNFGSSTDQSTIDFLVTIPFTFLAEKFGVKFVLWCNLVPRIFMSFWVLVVGMSINQGPLFLVKMSWHNSSQSRYQIHVLNQESANHTDASAGHFDHILPTKAIIIGPLLSV